MHNGFYTIINYSSSFWSGNRESTLTFRIFAAANSILWIGYDIGTLAWTTIITHAFSLSSSLIGIIRLDLGKKNKEANIDNKQ